MGCVFLILEATPCLVPGASGNCSPGGPVQAVPDREPDPHGLARPALDWPVWG